MTCKRFLFSMLLGVGSDAANTAQTAAPAAATQANHAALVAQQRAADISAAEYGLVCDAKEIPVSAHGVFQNATLAPGFTDNTVAIANFVAALGVANGTAPQGANGETTTGPIHQKKGILPPGCSYALSSWPNSIPEAVLLDGNQSSGYITSASGHGPYWDSLIGTGTSNNTAHGFRLVYAGPMGQSTGDGITILGGGYNKIYDNDVFGFRSGVALGAGEYTNVYGNNLAHNALGIMALSATFANNGVTPSTFSATGTPSINNNFWGNTYRGNKVNVWFNGSTTSVIGPGSASFGSVAGIVFGALDFLYVDAITISGGASATCAPSQTVALAFADPKGTLLPEGIIETDSSGHLKGAFSTNGGRVSSGVTVSVSKPTALKCNATVSLTPHIASMASYLPFGGVATAGNSQNILEPQNIENEGIDANGNYQRPQSGYQIIADPSAGDLYIERPINGLSNNDPSLFAHFMLNQGVNTKVLDPLVYGFLDSSTGATCPFVSTTPMKIIGSGHDVDNSGFVCNSAYVTDYATGHGITGFDNGLLQDHGFSAYGFGSSSDLFLKSRVPGDTHPRVAVAVDGTTSLSIGSSPADIQFGPYNYRFAQSPAMGRIYGLATGKGVRSDEPIGVSVTGGQLNFTENFNATNSSAAYPNPGSSGIHPGPLGSLCKGTWQYDGNGTGPTAHYGAIATCNNGQDGIEQVYKSLGQTLGSEVWTPGGVALESIAATQARSPAAGTPCYQPNQFTFWQDKHILFCNGNPGTWSTIF